MFNIGDLIYCLGNNAVGIITRILYDGIDIKWVDYSEQLHNFYWNSTSKHYIKERYWKHYPIKKI